MDQISEFPQNSYIESLTPKIVVFEMGPWKVFRFD